MHFLLYRRHQCVAIVKEISGAKPDKGRGERGQALSLLSSFTVLTLNASHTLLSLSVQHYLALTGQLGALDRVAYEQQKLRFQF